jgi:hypothetical protein
MPNGGAEATRARLTAFGQRELAHASNLTRGSMIP